MMNRRKLLQGIASGATAAVASPLLPGIANAASGSTGKSPKRVIFSCRTKALILLLVFPLA